MPVRGQGAQAIAQRSPHPFTPSVRVNEREPAEPERALGGGDDMRMARVWRIE